MKRYLPVSDRIARMTRHAKCDKAYAIFIILALLCLSSAKIRVCETFSAYNTPTGDSCHYSYADEYNVPQIIEHWGFKTTNYTLQTPDGYLLSLFRAHPASDCQNYPIVLGHGVLTNSIMFVYRNNQSLAHQLLELGFDVWLVNFRGTRYSRGHVNKTTEDQAYWDFNIDQVGMYDLRTILEHVYDITNRKAVYVGYSMGSTVCYVLASRIPGLAKTTLKSIISLAPVGYIDVIVLEIISPSLTQLFLRTFFGDEFFKQTANLKAALNFFSLSPPTMFVFQTILSPIFGFDYAQMDAISYPVFINVVFDSIAVGILDHFLQMDETGKFASYNYGTARNLATYGWSNPPEYPLEHIQVPVTMFVSLGDYTATQKAAKKTYLQLQEEFRNGFHVVNSTEFTHLDFVTATNVSELLFKCLFQTIHNIAHNKT